MSTTFFLPTFSLILSRISWLFENIMGCRTYSSWSSLYNSTLRPIMSLYIVFWFSIYKSRYDMSFQNIIKFSSIVEKKHYTMFSLTLESCNSNFPLYFLFFAFFTLLFIWQNFKLYISRKIARLGMIECATVYCNNSACFTFKICPTSINKTTET